MKTELNPKQHESTSNPSVPLPGPQWINSPESYACDITLRHAKTPGCTVIETTNSMVAVEIKEAFEPLKMNVKEVQK